MKTTRVQFIHGLECSPQSAKATVLAEPFESLTPAMDTSDFAGCVAILAFFHVSLSGRPAVSAFPRLVVLAWPAALLLHWRWRSPRLPSLAAAILAVWLGAVSLWIGTHQVAGAVVLQKQRLPYFPRVLETLEQDRPDWLELGGAAQRRR